MPAATASCRLAARSDTGWRSTTAKSVTANLPPSSAAMRSNCTVSHDTELSRSFKTAASEPGSCFQDGRALTSALIRAACSRSNTSTSSRTYSGLPCA